MKTTESNNNRTIAIDEMNGKEIAELINKEDQLVAKMIGDEVEQIGKAIELYAKVYQDGNKIITIGAGSSGRYGVIDNVELVPTYNANKEQFEGIICGGKEAMFGSIEGAEDHKEYAEEDLQKAGIKKGDLVIGIAASGDTPYTLGALVYAKKVGAYTISICCNKNSAMSKVATIAIDPELGPEVISGSTRMKGGTAAKIILNMLSTGAMVRSGRVYENYMVYVQPRNKKLVQRMISMLESILDIGQEEAEQLYENSGHCVAVGLVMYWCQVNCEKAKQALAESGGFVRQAVKRIKTE